MAAADDDVPVLGNDRVDRVGRNSVLLVWAPLASLALVEQEHGRTIPLAEAEKSGRA
jgi:hypothetical protein